MKHYQTLFILFIFCFTLSESLAAPADQTEQKTKEKTKAHPDVQVNTLVICTGLEKRKPVGEDTKFSHTKRRLIGYIEVDNPLKKRTLVMKWFYKDRVRSRLTLDVGRSKRWRTWGRQRISSATIGSWRVEVSTEDGTVLAQTTFEVTQPAQ